MKLYKNKELTEEISILDFGILAAGESKTFSFYAKNDSDAELRNLTFSVEHKELSMIEFPKNLLKKESAELKIKWTPSVTLREGLKTKLNISGIELWG
jgi:hypothetical protein